MNPPDAKPSDSPDAVPPDPPDWDRITEEIRCPLCEYNLRGLTRPRCPECGYRFDWPEILDPARRLHPYLFEHHPERNVRSFWRTIIAGFRPDRFWRSLNPIQPQHSSRLIIYWSIIAGAFLLATACQLSYFTFLLRAQVRAQRTWQLTFLNNPANAERAAQVEQDFGSVQAYVDRCNPVLSAWDALRVMFHDPDVPVILCMYVIVPISWPWLTVLALLLFQTSMRRKRIRFVHVTRCAVYSFDAVCWFAIMFMFMALVQFVEGALAGFVSMPASVALWFPWSGLGLTALTGLFGIYRLAVAYRQYLRFDHAIATALSSQVIVCLFVIDVALIVKFW